MNIRNVIDNYIECNNFEVKYINNKLFIYYYNDIKDFSSNEINISYNDKKLIIKGNNLVIETMYKEYLIINGNIKSLEFKDE